MFVLLEIARELCIFLNTKVCIGLELILIESISFFRFRVSFVIELARDWNIFCEVITKATLVNFHLDFHPVPNHAIENLHAWGIP